MVNSETIKYINTKNPDEKVSFKEATLNGLGSNKGLYVPDRIPKLAPGFFEDIQNTNDIDIAFQVMQPYVRDSINKLSLIQILKETLSFPTPAEKLSENIFVLELFHGPTMAFKDVGAKFIALCMSKFSSSDKNLKVIVATSGDTGSAVAHGFYKVKGVDVYILYPKGKVSMFQEQQMTSLSENITAIEVEGTFDDCQALAKQALNDADLNEQLNLSSANSINVARFLPQMLYYFLAYKQLKPLLEEKEFLVSVPSGNFGNLTAGLYAKKMGLPIHRLIAANNANDTFYQYYNSGQYQSKKSLATYSNAMDVGSPSNFERIMHLFGNNLTELKKDVLASYFSDRATLQEIKSTFEETGYVLDPHGAIGLLALKQHIKSHQLGLFLATASPAKFEKVVKKAIKSYTVKDFEAKATEKIKMKNSYSSLVEILCLPNNPSKLS